MNEEGSIMNYCEKCYHLNDQEECSCCGNKKLRGITDQDICFLIEKQTIWAEMLKEKLDNAEIPYECVGGMGAAMAIKAGPYLENYQFYVPYAYYPKAKNIIDEMFSQDQTAE